jgi:hypothetical protein
VSVDFFAPKEGHQLPKSWVSYICNVIFNRLLKQFKVLVVVTVDVKSFKRRMTIEFAERAQLVILDEAIDPLLMVATSLYFVRNVGSCKKE